MPPFTLPRRLMLQGTSSDVGKSLLVAGLCRAYAIRGLAVRPFKAQNISNNAAVTPDSDLPGQTGEIGRAQAFQALACRVAPSIHMNPVLLKPQAGVGSQVVVRGRGIGNCRAKDYATLRPRLMPMVLDSLDRVGRGADLVLVEGAGSPVETYLKDSDIVNMALAEAAGLPVLMVGDVDRGGALAALIGTHALFTPQERARVKGYLVNKLRGDFSLFAPACETITTHTGWPCAGLIGWFEGATAFPAEDSLALDTRKQTLGRNALRVAILRWPHLSNFDDFDPLVADPLVDVHWVTGGQPLPRAVDVIILPGSKSTCQDLRYVRAQGWDHDLFSHLHHGGRILGICGGFQMLGRVIRDVDGLEGPPEEVNGLGLMDFETTLTGTKRLEQIAAQDQISAQPVTGYEMHMGQTTGAALDRPFLRLDLGHGTIRPEGAVSSDGRVMGSYIHGLFASDPFRHHWLMSVGGAGSALPAYAPRVERALDDLAAHLEKTLDLDALLDLAL